MKPIAIKQEILLMTGTTYALSQLCRISNSESHDYFSQELLEEACWNGMLPELLPEVFEELDSEKLYLWLVRQGEAFLQLELGEQPSLSQIEFSLDPYLFLSAQSCN